MIPQDKNIRQRVNTTLVLLFGLAAILVFMKAQPLPYAFSVALAFAIIIGFSNRWLSDTVDND